MKILRGVPSAWNYTYGPAYFYKGPRSLDEIYHAGEPVVVVSDWIPIDELRKMELTRVRGFVLEQGSAIDEDHYNFFMNEKRAAVMGAKFARLNMREGDWIIVDGVEGVVCVDPTPEVLEKFQQFRKAGPPKRGPAAAAAYIMKATMEAFFKKREEEQAAGVEGGQGHALAHGHPHALEKPSMAEFEAKMANQPSLISLLLQGVDLPKPEDAPEEVAAPRGRGGREVPTEPSAAERARGRRRGPGGEDAAIESAAGSGEA